MTDPTGGALGGRHTAQRQVETALNRAVRNDDIEQFRALLPRVDIRSMTERGISPLRFAPNGSRFYQAIQTHEALTAAARPLSPPPPYESPVHHANATTANRLTSPFAPTAPSVDEESEPLEPLPRYSLVAPSLTQIDDQDLPPAFDDGTGAVNGQDMGATALPFVTLPGDPATDLEMSFESEKKGEKKDDLKLEEKPDLKFDSPWPPDKKK